MNTEVNRASPVRWLRSSVAVFAVVALSLLACGLCALSVNAAQTPPVINALSANPPGLSQALAPFHGGPFILTINGQNFQPSAQAEIGGNVLATTFVNSTQLTAVVPSSLLTTLGTVPVIVSNPPYPGLVTLNVTSAVAVGAYQVTIKYDKNIVSLQTGSVTGGTGPGFTDDPLFNANNAAGIVTINHFQVGNSPSGTFSVARLSFTPVAAGISNLTLTVDSLTDTLGNELPRPPAEVSLSASVLDNTNRVLSNAVVLKVVQRGDINANLSVNIGDALATALTVGGSLTPPLPISVGDINLNGAVTIGDALTLSLFAARTSPNLPTPVIQSFSPSPAQPGANLTITASGLGTNTTDHQVLFPTADGVVRVTPASLTFPEASVQPTALIVSVPANVVSGAIQIFRTDAAMGSPEFPLDVTGSSSPLILTDVDPFYAVTPGNSVRLTGMGFSATPTANSVVFRTANGTAAGLVTAATPTSLTVVVPPTAVCGDVTVMTSGQKSNGRAVVISGTDCTLRIVDVWGGGVPGDTIVVEGVGFDAATPSNNVVAFTATGGATVIAPVIQAGQTQLHVKIPATGADGFLRVTVGGQTSNLFTPSPPLRIGLDQNNLIFTTAIVGNSPPNQTVNISNAGGGTLNWTANAVSNGNWLSVTPGSGTGGTVITVSASAGTLAGGTTYTGSITFSAPGAVNSPLTLPVIFRVAQAETTGYTISTVAGQSVITEGGAATTQPLPPVYDVARDSQGNLYIASPNAHKVFKVTPEGVLSTFAGTGMPGPAGDGGLAASAQLNGPRSVNLDASGNLYIADANNNRIRKVATDGIITSVAGTGIPGFTGDGGPAVLATLSSPSGLGMDASGNLLINDRNNNRLRKVGIDGRISTVAGNGTAGFSGDGQAAAAAQLSLDISTVKIAVDSAGNLYIPDTFNNRIRKVAASDGTITTIAGTGAAGFSGDDGSAAAAQLSGPRSVVFDTSGNLIISDTNNRRIRRIGPTGTIGTIAGNGNFTFNGDGAIATSVALGFSLGLAVGASGDLYIADQVNGRIRRLAANGSITTVAGKVGVFSGDNGPATSAMLYSPASVAVDSSGNLFIADRLNARIRKVAPDGTITTIAGTGSLGAVTGDGGPAVSAALGIPIDIAVDNSGNIYFTDTTRVRKIAPNGIISTIAGGSSSGFSGDGGLATQAQFANAQGIAVDTNGNVYIADSGNNRVRKVAIDGSINTIAGTGTAGSAGDGGSASAAQLNFPRKLALDGPGNLYIADSNPPSNNGRIRKVALDGTISTVATTLGRSVAVGSILNASQVAIARVNSDTTSSILAGLGFGISGDGGPALMAAINVSNLAVSPVGEILFADDADHVIRKLTPVATGSAALSVSPSGFHLRAVAGVSQAVLTIRLNGSGTFTWNATTSVTTPAGANWLSLTQSSGAESGTTNIVANSAGLTPGSYNGVVTVTSPHAVNGSVTVPVSLTVLPPVISLNPSSITSTGASGGANPPNQIIQVNNSVGGTFTFSATASVSTPAGGSWLSVSPASGSSGGSLTVSFNTAGLAAGSYSGAITVTSASATNSPVTVPVTLTVNPGSLPTIASIQPSTVRHGISNVGFQINGANLAGGMVVATPAPGSMNPANVSFSPVNNTSNTQLIASLTVTSGGTAANWLLSVSTAAGTSNTAILSVLDPPLVTGISSTGQTPGSSLVDVVRGTTATLTLSGTGFQDATAVEFGILGTNISFLAGAAPIISADGKQATVMATIPNDAVLGRYAVCLKVPNSPCPTDAFHTPPGFQAVTFVQVKSAANAPTILSTAGGNFQNGSIGLPLSSPLVAIAQENGVALAGMPVTFMPTSGGGSVRFASFADTVNKSSLTVRTGTDGKASAVGVLGPNTGVNTFTAAVADSSPISTVFTATGSIVMTTSDVSYSIPDRGAIVATSSGSSNSLAVGHTRIQPDSANITPSGIAIVSFRVNPIISEMAIPAMPLIQNGRLAVLNTSAVLTGVAFANPNSQAATVSFFFTDPIGADFGQGSFVIAANSSLARFLSEAPFNAGSFTNGTFTFSSNVPVSAVEVVGRTNERGEFLLTSLPVQDLSALTGSGTVVLSHFVTGGGSSTRLILMNSGDTVLNGHVEFVDSSGAPATVTANGQTFSTFAYSIAPRSTLSLLTDNVGASILTGSIRVVPEAGSGAPVVQALYSFRSAGITVSEVGVSPTSGNAFRMYAEAFGTFPENGSVQSIVSIANSSANTASATLDLTDLNGGPLALTLTLQIPPRGQVTRSIGELFAGHQLPPMMRAVLRITSSGPELSVVGMRGRLNERGDLILAATPPSNEALGASAAQRSFQFFVDGGGYTTQFILFSGTANQSATGHMQFLSQSGTPLGLELFTSTPPSAPMINSIQPVSVRRGEFNVSFQVNGSNLAGGIAQFRINNQVSQDLSLTNINNTSSTQLLATLAVGTGAALGTHNVSVLKNGVTSNSANLTVFPMPNVTSASLNGTSPGVQFLQVVRGNTVTFTATGTEFRASDVIMILPSFNSSPLGGVGTTTFNGGLTIATATVSVPADAPLGMYRLYVRPQNGNGTSQVAVQVTSGAPITLNIDSGNQQTGPPGGLLANPLVVLGHENGIPVGGLSITFTPGTGGGSVRFATFDDTVNRTSVPAFTGVDGKAAARGVLGPAAGNHTFVAVVDGNPQSVEFTATAAGASAPTISSIQPVSVQRGEFNINFQINGNNLAGGAVEFRMNNQVSQQLSLTNVNNSTDTQLLGTLAVGTGAALGTHNVSVVKNGVVSNSANLTVFPFPIVTSASLNGTSPGVQFLEIVRGSTVTFTATGRDFRVADAMILVPFPNGSALGGVGTTIFNADFTIATATVNVPADAPLGMYRLEVRPQNGFGPSSVTVRVKSAENAAIALSIDSGNQQTGPPGGLLANPLVVFAHENSIPVGGLSVTFIPGTGGGSVRFATFDDTVNRTSVPAFTSADGKAAARGVLGPAAGNHTFIATIDGSSQNVVFTATASASGATVSSIRPVSVRRGEFNINFQINGNNLAGGAAELRINGQVSQQLSLTNVNNSSDTQLIATLAVGTGAALGTHSVSVVKNGVASNSANLTVFPMPMVTSASLNGTSPGVQSLEIVRGSIVTFTATGTDFRPTDTMVILPLPGGGVPLGVVGTTTFDASVTVASATVNVPADAPLGMYGLHVHPQNGSFGSNVIVRVKSAENAQITLGMNSGNSQTGPPGGVLTNPLVVLAHENGIPVRGLSITFAPATGGGSVRFSSFNDTENRTSVRVFTGVDGKAAARGVLGPAAGNHTFIATVDGTPQSVEFTATASTPGPTVSSIQPVSVRQGEFVDFRIDGSNLAGGGVEFRLNNQVSQQLSLTNINNSSSTQLVATLRVNTSAILGTYNVSVLTSGGPSNSANLTVFAKPNVTGGSLDGTSPGIQSLEIVRGTTVTFTATGTEFRTSDTLMIRHDFDGSSLGGVGTTTFNGALTVATAVVNVPVDAPLGIYHLYVSPQNTTSRGSLVTVRVKSVENAQIALSVDSGNMQTGAPGSVLTNPLVVNARENGLPIGGLPIIFAPGTGGGSVRFAFFDDTENRTSIFVTTAMDGKAAARGVLGPAAGNHTFVAAVSGGSQNVEFTATALAGVTPVFDSITPISGQQDQSGINFTIAGQNLATFNGVQFHINGSNDPAMVVTNFAVQANQITGTLAVGNAMVGSHSVVLTSAGGNVTTGKTFQVIPRATFIGIAPNNVVQGQEVNFAITGQNLDRANGVSFFLDGSVDPKVTVRNLQVQTGQISGIVNVAADASIGGRGILISGLDLAGANSGLNFVVNPAGGGSGAPTFSTLVPNSGNPGQALSFMITGQNLLGFTSVQFHLAPFLSDDKLVVSNLSVHATQITGTVTIAPDATGGSRSVILRRPFAPDTNTNLNFSVNIP